MRLAVVVPMKPFALAKARLRPGLGDVARQKLAADMLRHVLAAVAASRVAKASGVVSADPAALALAREYGFAAIFEESPKGYNQAVMRASAWAQARQCDALLILPGDLRHISPEDIQFIARLAEPHSQVVVVAPDAKAVGTNALLMRPLGLIRPSFGPNSFRQHCAAAHSVRTLCLTYYSFSTAHDVDYPSDLIF